MLFNDSFFGPFNSIEQIFDDMDNKNVDFWSMTKNNGNVECKAAIQSYFFVVRKRLLLSKDFKEYWEEMPYYDSFKSTVQDYEMKIAEYFENRGYSWDSYIDSDRYAGIAKTKYRLSLYHTVPNEIMEKQRFPFLKRKLFDLDSFGEDYGLDKQTRENFILAMKYIATHTNYDMRLIWNNILRTYSLRNIQDCCCMRKIVDERTSGNADIKVKAIIWLHEQTITYDNLYRIFHEFSHSDMIIGTDSKILSDYLKSEYKCTKAKTYSNKHAFYINIIMNWDKYLDGCEIIACFNDIDCEYDFDTHYVTKASTVWNRWENTFGESNYVENIKLCFQNENNLGMLVPPKPLHAKYFSNNYTDELKKELITEFGLDDYVTRSIFLADWGECFWIRKSILDKKIISKFFELLQYENLSDDLDIQLYKLMPYICQKKKFYTSIVETNKYASVYEEMQSVYLRFFLDKFNGEKESFCKLQKIIELKELNESEIKSFVSSHNEIFIYGCGEISNALIKSNLIDNINGFIVSDGKSKPKSYNGYHVNYLSEIVSRKGVGIIVALNDKNSNQVKPVVLSHFSHENVLFLKNGGRF